MKVTILQRGGFKDHHQILEEAANYYGKMLMSTRMCNSLSVRIEMRASKLGKDGLGSCSAEALGSKANKEFTIIMRRDADLKESLEVLAHEMVHVAQKATNALQYRLWKSDNKYHARWGGKDVGLSSDIPYLERPWEREAYALDGVLLRAYAAKHKGNTEKEAKYREAFSQSYKAQVKLRSSFSAPEISM